MIRLFNLLKIPIKNIMRYKRNHYIMVAIAIAAFMVVLLSGMVAGIKDQLFKLMYTNYTGDIMLINEDVKIREDPSPIQVGWDKLLVDSGQIAEIKRDGNIRDVFGRLTVMASAMGEDDEKNQYVTVIGCDFRKEENNSFEALLKFVERDTEVKEGVYISKKIGEKLELTMGKAIYLFFFTDMGLVPAKLEVAGVFSGKGYPGVVDALVYVDYLVLKEALMLSNDRYSYFLLTVKDKSRITDTLSAIKKIIPADWKDVSPEESGKFFLSQETMYNFILDFSIGLMYLSIFLFIYSTLAISIKERQRELGIMASMGISRKGIFGLFSGEGVLLGFLPALCGCLLGLVVVLLMSVIGIPAFNEAMKYGVVSDVLYFKVDIRAVVQLVLGVSLTAFIGSILPILKILKVRPVDILRNE